MFSSLVPLSMTSLGAFARRPFHWRPRSTRTLSSAVLRFPSTGFPLVSDSVWLEEERFAEFRAGQYYPANIGDVLGEKYQVLGKLGFGATSTVWLARNLQKHEQQYVTLKIYTRDGGKREEFETYEALRKADRSHPGYSRIRTALEVFKLERPGASGITHHCLVQKPMWDSFKDIVRWHPSGLFTVDLLKAGLSELFLALDYLHLECNIVHTDIKADNIMSELVDESVFEAFVKSEMEDPSPRKLVDGVPVYASRQFDMPDNHGNIALSDFGEAVRGDQKRDHVAQPQVYRSPEVMLGMEWTYPVDIWNVGVMIWDLFEGRQLFQGDDPEQKRYRTRAHLAELVALLGPPPPDFLRRGKRSDEFFSEEGEWKAGIPIPQSTSLEKSITRLEGAEKEAFLTFVRGMLQWRPEDRKTASELFFDPWLQN